MSLTDTRSTAIFWGGKFFEEKRVKNRFLGSVKLCYNGFIKKFRQQKNSRDFLFGDWNVSLIAYLIY